MVFARYRYFERMRMTVCGEGLAVVLVSDKLLKELAAESMQ